MPACRRVISPSSTRLIACPPCVCHEVHAPEGKPTTSCTTSACRGALVTSNRDSATTLRSAGPPALRLRTVAGLAAVAIAMVRTRRLVYLGLLGIGHLPFLQRAVTIVVQAL